METDELTTESRVGEIAAAHPLATRVFARYGIDFCCGGGMSLRRACSDRGLAVEAVLEEIHGEVGTVEELGINWLQEPLSSVIDHILSAFHEPLREELPRLEEMARKVLRVHREKDPERLSTIMDLVASLRCELEDHMLKEERILFPMIVDGRGGEAGAPVSVMEQEHLAASEALAALRHLTNDFQVPEYACNTWRALWAGLESLDRDLKEHIHLENNILFPRALAD